MIPTEIHVRLDEMPPRFHRRIEARIRSSLRRFAGRLTRARVFLGEESSVRGDSGARCRLLLETGRGELVVATGRGRDALGALAGALRRARKSLLRREQRRVSRERARHGRRDAWTAA